MLYLGPEKKLNNSAAKLDCAITDWQQYYQQQAKQVKDPLLKQFYQAGMVAASTPISQVPLLALDFETTGIDPAANGIVSIGLVPMTLTHIASSQAKQWLLKPKFALKEGSITLHGITHSDIADAPDLVDILPQLLPYLAGKVIVVHYRGIERPFFQAALKARLGENILFPVIDTMELESRLYRQAATSWWQRLLGNSATAKPSIRLADSRKRYGLPVYRPHHAVTDAIACAELLQAQIADRFDPSTPIAQLWH